MDERSLNQLIRVSMLYYHKGIEQRKIAELLGVSTKTVSRMLQRARDLGIVEFKIKSQYD